MDGWYKSLRRAFPGHGVTVCRTPPARSRFFAWCAVLLTGVPWNGLQSSSWAGSIICVESALNIHPNLGETMVEMVRGRIMIDNNTLPKGEVYSTCSSLEQFPCCFPASGSTDYVSCQSADRYDRMPTLQDKLGEPLELKSVSPILADGVSWLLAQSDAFTELQQSRVTFSRRTIEELKEEDASLQPSENMKGLEEKEARQSFEGYGVSEENVMSKDKPTREGKQNKTTLSLPKAQLVKKFYLQRIRNVILEPLLHNFNKLFGTAQHDENGGRTLSWIRDVLRNSSFVQDASPTKEANSSSLRNKIPPPRVFWTGVTLHMNFDNAPQGLLPEFSTVASHSSPGDEMYIRWLGGWGNVIRMDTHPRFARLQGAELRTPHLHHMFFSKPVVVSQFMLMLLNMTSSDSHMENPLLIEGWVWNKFTRKDLVSQDFHLNGSQDARSWFFSVDPLELVNQRQIERVWFIKLKNHDISVNEPTNVMRYALVSPYIRVNGITISGGSPSTALGLISLVLHRAVQVNKEGKVIQPTVTLTSANTSTALNAQPAIVLRHVDYSFVQPELPSGETVQCNDTMLCDVRSIDALARTHWTFHTKRIVETLANEDMHPSEDLYSLFPEQNDGFSTDLLCKISSDGIAFNWDNRAPMQLLVVVFHPALPVEAPVVSLRDLDVTNHFVSHRPVYGLKAQNWFVPPVYSSSVSSLENKWSNETKQSSSLFKTMAIKRKLIDAARSAAVTAKRLQHVRKEMEQTYHESMTLHKPFSFERHTNKDVDNSENGQDVLTHLFREELLRLLQEAVHKDIESAKQSTEGGFATFDHQEDDGFKEITIAEVSGKNGSVSRKFRFNLITGTVVNESSSITSGFLNDMDEGHRQSTLLNSSKALRSDHDEPSASHHSS